MGLGRLAPHWIRARYAKALNEIPLPVRSFGGIDPAALTVLAEVEIAGQVLRFGRLAQVPRLWITLPDQYPQVMGFLTGLETGRPDLHLTELDHLEWASRPGRAAHIKREALTAWNIPSRNCEG
ncbi:hypothetical protein GCM10009830_05100 [Glycomyces endophyticus]|uniref:Uncharacterized protein n=1 Tax=Glycomyces endophyticus TaxID=480996 RepID=A0ABN2G0E6_9ACTN